MNKPNITEGEWKAGPNSTGEFEVGTGWTDTGAHPMIASINSAYFTPDAREANSKAISAVPEMIDALYGMYLSMKAHPDYQTGRNQEFIDYVNKAESALEKAGGKL